MKRKDWIEDDKRNIQFYTELVSIYGIDPRALNWGSRESQRLRFHILAQVGQINGASILDVGCGIGDFFCWLKEHNLKVKYTGIDITPKMIEIAKQRFPEAHFEVGSLEEINNNKCEHYDYVFASGIFCYRTVEPFEFLKKTVKLMFSICNKAIAFNSLSSWATKKETGEFYADPLETLAFCRTLTPWVVLRHDYHPRDFTIYMYKKMGKKV